MRIAILSDSHSNFANIELALRRLRAMNVEQVFHCGDIDSPQAAEMFADFHTSFVFGNVDGDHEALRHVIECSKNRCYERVCEVELEGRKIAMTHGHDTRCLRAIECAGRYDFVFYGHTHVAEHHRVGSTRVINPGALHRARIKSLATADLADLSFEFITLEGTSRKR